MQSDEINVCSGYFIDFITLDDYDNYDNYKAAKGVDLYRYNSHTKSNIHLKQLAGSESKYNIDYFQKLQGPFNLLKEWGGA